MCETIYEKCIVIVSVVIIAIVAVSDAAREDGVNRIIMRLSRSFNNQPKAVSRPVVGTKQSKIVPKMLPEANAKDVGQELAKNWF